MNVSWIANGLRLFVFLITGWVSISYGQSCNDSCSKFHGCCFQSNTSRCSNDCVFQSICMVKVCSHNGAGSCPNHIGDQYSDACWGTSYHECPQWCI